MKNLRYILFTLWALFAVVGCTKTYTSGPEHEYPEGDYAIDIPLSLGSPQALRALVTGAKLKSISTEEGSKYHTPDQLNENKIEKIEVFFFNSTSGRLILKYANDEVDRLAPTTNPQGLKVRVIIPRPSVSSIEGQRVKVVVVANATENLSAITTYDQLKQKRETYTQINATTTPRNSFLMDGIADVSNIRWRNNPTYELPTAIRLKRALAKIRLRIGDIKIIDFQNGAQTSYEVVGGDISVKLLRYKNATSLLSVQPFSDAPEIAQTEYRRMKDMNFPNKRSPKHRGTTYKSAFPFYAGECTWEPRSNHEVYMIARIKLRPTGTNRPGKYYYYKLPIDYHKAMDHVAANKLNKVERNHLYDVFTTIGQLGSEDEGTPVKIRSNVSIEPWPTHPDAIDGSITAAHYLVVKENTVIMADVGNYPVEYVSDLPIAVSVAKVYYEYYDKKGDYYKVVFDHKTQGKSYTFYTDPNETHPLSVQEVKNRELVEPTQYLQANHEGKVTWTKDKYIKGGSITIMNDIPKNFTPLQILLSVKQVSTDPNYKPLTKEIHVIQLPPIFVTGHKSKGFVPTASDIAAGREFADFRYHSTLGNLGRYQGSNNVEPQKNEIFNRVTIAVPGVIKYPNGVSLPLILGDPTDSNGRTKTDAKSNQIVSPEFIIASQYGMCLKVKQSGGSSISTNPNTTNFQYGWGYGGSSKHYVKKGVYYKPTVNGPGLQGTIIAYSSAVDRCENYFEGEYGTDGDYVERYIGQDGRWHNRTVHKTFKYKGHWRIPTSAEIRLIDKIQDDPNTVTKGLLFGSAYWTAERGMQYKFTEDKLVAVSIDDIAPVRCIFDTYKFDDSDD